MIIKIKEKSGNDILLNSSFILDYIKQIDISFNFNKKNILFEAPHCKWNEICNNKNNLLIIIKSDNEYIFGGFMKKGFSSEDKKIKDVKCFLFSANLSKIYPVKTSIRYSIDFGLCFTGSLHLHSYDGIVISSIKQYCNAIDNNYEMNGGKKRFSIEKVEIYELLLNDE